MQIELITKKDLEIFRLQLLADLQELLKHNLKNQKQWLKSSEVRAMLKISSGTLQNLRINRKVNPTRVGGSFYYRLDEIEMLLERKD